jgi:hypothetical protein
MVYGDIARARNSINANSEDMVEEPDADDEESDGAYLHILFGDVDESKYADENNTSGGSVSNRNSESHKALKVIFANYEEIIEKLEKQSPESQAVINEKFTLLVEKHMPLISLLSEDFIPITDFLYKGKPLHDVNDNALASVKDSHRTLKLTVDIYEAMAKSKALKEIEEIVVKYNMILSEVPIGEEMKKMYNNAVTKGHINHRYGLTEAGKPTGHEGLIARFNKVYKIYLETFLTAKSSGKIYKDLISGYCDGIASGEVYNESNVIIDMFETKQNKSKLTTQEKNGNHILYESLAKVSKFLMTRVDSKRKLPTSTFSNLADVPNFMVELMRANLPYFEKVFALIQDRAQYISGMVTDDAPRLACSNLISHTSAIIKCINTVQKELDDVPIYGELYSGSIRDYKKKTGSNPLTPLVLLSKGGNKGFASKFGTDEFKFQYTTRLLLGNNEVIPDLQYAPFYMDTIDGFNNSIRGQSISKQQVSSLVYNNVTLSRYVSDIDYSKIISYRAPSPPQTNDYNTFGDVSRIANYDKSVSIKGYLTEFNEPLRTNDERERQIKINIVDLNLVPINVNAMMRDVPLINLSNYAYTCNEIIFNLDTITPKVPAGNFWSGHAFRVIGRNHRAVKKMIKEHLDWVGKPKYGVLSASQIARTSH